jgi:putative flippase GtrA
MKAFIDFAGINYRLAQIISSAIVLGVTYCCNLAWTFCRSNSSVHA